MSTHNATTLQNVLTAVKRVADHQAEIKRLNGENFNPFSILGMETAENKTHSAFFWELVPSQVIFQMHHKIPTSRQNQYLYSMERLKLNHYR